MTSTVNVARMERGESFAIRSLLAWIVVVVLLGFFAVPFLQPGQLGDFSSAIVDFYHAIMIPVAALFLLLCSMSFPIPVWARRWVFRAGWVGAGFDGIGSLLRAYGDLYHSAGFGIGAWIQMVGTLTMVSVTLVFLIGLAQSTHKDPASARLLTWALFAAGLSALIAVSLGGIFATSEVGLSWAGLAHAFHENSQTFLGNVSTSHSHDMLPAFMGSIVLLTGRVFGYPRLKGVRRRIGQVGIVVMVIGVVLMTIVYVVSSLGTYNIPTLWASGPHGVNGIAADDFLTGLVGWGSLILMASLWPEIRNKAQTLTATVRQRVNPVRLAVFLTWICAMIAMIGYGYFIELHENIFGGGQLPAAGAVNDQIFTRAHLLYVFFALPILAVLLLAAELTADKASRGIKWMAECSIGGMGISLIGLGWWTFATPGHALSWNLAGGGHDLYVLGQALMLTAGIIQLFSTRTEILASSADDTAPPRHQTAE